MVVVVICWLILGEVVFVGGCIEFDLYCDGGILWVYLCDGVGLMIKFEVLGLLIF